jgi:ribosomal protein L29
MKIKELKLKSDNELKVKLEETLHKLREMRFKVAQRQLKSVRNVRQEKKIKAQILTIMKERIKALKH